MRQSTALFPLAALVLAWSSTAAADNDGWLRIDAPAPSTPGLDGEPRCSGAPIFNPATPLMPDEADPQFSFFIRYGHPHKLAILFDGGGTCFESDTCLLSSYGGFSVYDPIVDEDATKLGNTGGLGDEDNGQNPIADYTQVFIPYCTGDLHIGDSATTYDWPNGPAGEWTIHHRGADNVAFVLDWLDDHYGGSWPRDVFMTGLSAGGYGVVYHTPAVAARLPWYGRLRVLADAASGVITENFYNLALDPNGVWRAWDNLSPVLMPAFASGPDNIIIEIYKALGSAYPNARFGQYTTAFDTVQVFFYNIDRNVGDVPAWFNPIELLAAGFEWTLRARTYQILTALQTWNYRYYLAAGDEHTVLASDSLFTEDSGGGVDLVDWLDDMINRFWPWGSDWRNVSCTPNCPP